jgi:ferric iron reductase protein FhuF
MHPDCAEIDRIRLQLIEMLQSQQSIPEDPFFMLVGAFSAALKRLLSKYFEKDASGKDLLRPIVNYYRQVQNYLVFLLRYPDILQIPQHSEIEQTLRYLHDPEKWINEVYMQLAEKEKNLMSGDFRESMERLFSKK